MHEVGSLTTYYGMIVEHNLHNSHVNMNNPVIVVNIETGIVLKMGDEVTSGIKEWYETAVQSYISSGFTEEANAMQLISFDRYSGVLDIDGICTLINYMRNTIGSEKMKKILSMTETELIDEVKKLQDIGF